MKMHKLGFGVLLIAGVMSLSGCIVTASHNTRTHGKVLSDSRLKLVEVGVTTRDELVARFGKPTHESKSGDTTVIEYEWSETKSSNSTFIFLWHVNNNKTKTNNAVFTFEKGVLKSSSVD